MIADAKAWLLSDEGKAYLISAMKEVELQNFELMQAGKVKTEYLREPFTPMLAKFAELTLKRNSGVAVAISQDSIELLAMELASEEHDDIHQLIWEGGAVPEPWGEVWQKYEGDAKRILQLAVKHLPTRYDAPQRNNGRVAAYNHHFIQEDDFMPEEVLSHSEEIPLIHGCKYAGHSDKLYTAPPTTDEVKNYQKYLEKSNTGELCDDACKYICSGQMSEVKQYVERLEAALSSLIVLDDSPDWSNENKTKTTNPYYLAKQALATKPAELK